MVRGGRHSQDPIFNPELGLINIKDPIPTFVSAFGPKARALTAKIGANWIGTVSWPQREEADMKDFMAAWKNNGRNVARRLRGSERWRLRSRRGRACRQPAVDGTSRPLRGDRVS